MNASLLVINQVITYVEFHSWFYHQIQFNRIDLTFKIKSFIAQITDTAELGDVAKNVNQMSKDEKRKGIVLCDLKVKSCDGVFQGFFKEDCISLKLVPPMLLFLYLANCHSAFEKRPPEFLRDLCGEEISDASLVVDLWSSTLLSTHANVSLRAI
jgi:hypothetical protein